MKKLLPILLALIVTSLSAQEVCNDGIDNDGDGLVDCFDGDCAGSANCTSFFFGNDASCQVSPTVSPNFSIKQQWASTTSSSDNLTYPAIGDLDGDGVPEVVVGNTLTGRITILDGISGEILFTTTVGFTLGRSMAIADVTQLGGTNCGEIFIRAFESTNIQAYDCELNLLWSINTNPSNGTPGLLSLADFNEDGVVELFHRNEIIDAATGNIIIAGDGPFETESAFGTVAVDVLPDNACDDCAGLELVDGNIVYAVDIANATLTVERDMNDVLAVTPGVAAGSTYFPKSNSATTGQRSMLSPADFNQDGHLDVLLTGALGSGPDDQTTIFFWDITNETVDFYQDLGNNFVSGSGRIAVADIDGDGQLNATFVINQTLISLDENLDVLWSRGVLDGSSGISGCSTFDFDGDGAHEVLYRSESTFHIIDGRTGNSFNQIFCQSRTWVEYPVVADIDADGRTEICITCSADDDASFEPFSNAQFGQVRVYEADGEQWLPSRGVWNQHAYFNVNINDDLTVPVTQQDHAVSLSTMLCDGTTGSNRSLNNFLGQSTLLDANGCPSLASSDVLLESITAATVPTCPDLTFEVDLVIENNGELNLARNLPLTFYEGDPFAAGATRLSTRQIDPEGLAPGETATFTFTLEVSSPDFPLFAVVNDEGTQALPLSEIEGVIEECDFGNNVQSVQATVLPSVLQVEKLSDNQVCDQSITPTGSARAYIDGVIPRDTMAVWTEDFEDLMDGASEDTGETAWSISFTPAGALNAAQVFNNAGNLFFVGNNLDSELVWTSETIMVDGFESVLISVDLISIGALEDGQDFMTFTYSIDGGTPILLNNGSVDGSIENGLIQAEITLPNNTASTLQLQARVFNTALEEFYGFDNILVRGVTAPVVGNITEGYTFRWFEAGDFTSVLFEGSLQDQLPDGDYDVVATNDAVGCISSTFSITIGQDNVDQFSVSITENSAVTSCIDPDGSLTANVSVGGMPATPADFTFNWFEGDVLSGVPIATSQTISELDAGEYSVEVTKNATGCVETQSVTITSTVVIPAVEVVTTDIVDCSNLSSGELTATSGGEVDGFTFQWFDGQGVSASPDFIGPTYSGIQAGIYTVIAIDNSTQCISEPFFATVQDNTVFPEVEFTSIVNNTTGNDGGASVRVTTGGLASPDGYTFELFLGNGTDPANQIATGAGGIDIINFSANEVVIVGLTDGEYTILVTDLSSNCETSSLFEIGDDFPPGAPVVTSPSAMQTVNRQSIIIAGTAEEGTLVTILRDFNGNDMVDAEDMAVGTPFQLEEGEVDFLIEVPLIQNSINDFVVISTDAAENVSTPTDVPAITEESVAFEWQGGAPNAASDWSVAANWVQGSVPVVDNDVLIPNTANDPVIDGAIHAINDLIIEDGAALDVASGAGLAIMGQVTLNGSGIVNVARNTEDDLGFSTVGSPITMATIEGLSVDFAFRYDEASNSFQNATGSMSPAEGFFIAENNSNAFATFSGMPNVGNVGRALSLLPSGNGILDGFNLVANPYAAPIDRSAFLQANGSDVISGTIWIWEDGGSNNGGQRAGDYMVVTNAGVTSSNPGNTFTTTTPIGSVQGFFVLADRNMAQLAFNPSMQVTSGNSDENFFRGTGEGPEQESVRLSLQGTGEVSDLYNEVLITLDDHATFGDDFALDGLKFSGNANISFYSLQNDQEYAIQAIPSIHTETVEVDLGFHLQQPGTYRVYLKELRRQSDHLSYYLIDRVSGEIYDLASQEEFSFQLNEAATVNDRFALQISPNLVTVVDSDQSDRLSILRGTYNGLTISYPSQLETAVLYDLSGKELLRDQIEFEAGVGELEANLKAGQVYLLKVNEEVVRFSIR